MEEIKKGLTKLDNGKGEFVDAEYCLTCWKYVLLAGNKNKKTIKTNKNIFYCSRRTFWTLSNVTFFSDL